MKNTIATVCIVTMLLNVASINANAVNTQPTTPAMNDIAVEYMGHGLYQATNDIALASSKKAIISRADDTDVFKIDDIYVIPVNGAENFIEVTPVEVDLSDKNTIKQTCARYSISKEIEQDLLDMAENNPQAPQTATVYTSQSDNSRSSKYYTYKNAKMRDDLVVCNNMRVDGRQMAAGKDTIAAIRKIVSAIFNVVTNDGKSEHVTDVAFFSHAYSLFEKIYTEANKVSFTSNNSDFCKFYATYNKTLKYTYADQNDGKGFQLGAKTVMLNFSDVHFITQLHTTNSTGGIDVKNTNNQATEFLGIRRTPHYMSPEAYAYGASSSGSLFTEDPYYIIINQTFNP